MNPVAQLLEPEVRELLKAERYRELRDALGGLEPHDVSEVIEALDADEAAVLFRLLSRETASDVFADLDPDQQEALVGHLGEARAARLAESLSPDDRVAFLDELPPAVASALIQRLSPENRRITQQILGYPDESVGRLMTPDYVRLRPEWTVARALEHLRKYGKDAETIDWVFVVDARGHLVDDMHIRTLLLADPGATIASLMDGRFVAVHARDDQEEAVRVMADYDRSALPVIDRDGVLLGIVTHDDIADVAQAEATEDIQMLGGMEALDEPYDSASVLTMFKKRGGWLAILLVGQTVTVGILSAFEDRLSAMLVLALFMPLVISCGGNSGSQAATLITRALALGEVTPGDWWRVLRRELSTGVLLGLLLGLLGVGNFIFWMMLGRVHAGDPTLVAMVIGLGVCGVVVWGTIVGSLLPIVLDRLGLDPATASTPLVATLMDASGMLIYFGIASMLLRSALGG